MKQPLNGGVGWILSKLEVEAECADGNRAAVGVEAGVVHELVIEGEEDVFGHAEGVVGFEDLLGGVIELAVAEDETEAAVGEVFAVVLGQAADYSGHGGHVVGAGPGGAFEGKAKRAGAIDFGEGPCFAVSVVPAGSAEEAQVGRDFLLGAEAVAVLWV